MVNLIEGKDFRILSNLVRYYIIDSMTDSREVQRKEQEVVNGIYWSR